VPVEIWTADFSQFPGSAEHLARYLSEDELARLARLREPEVRRRFLLRRAMLRRILSRAAGGPVHLTYGPYGKPALSSGGSPQFNFAHAGPFSVLAIGGRALGIDVALEEELPDLAGLVARTFAPDEQAGFADLPADLRLASFYRVWTQKEAVLKALGTGLSLEPDRFSVDVDPRAAPRLRGSRTPLIEPERWALAALELPGLLRGAIAAERPADPVPRSRAFDVLSLRA
jgi:4'-phosphopantetheinyl transferase